MSRPSGLVTIGRFSVARETEPKAQTTLNGLHNSPNRAGGSGCANELAHMHNEGLRALGEGRRGNKMRKCCVLKTGPTQRVRVPSG